MEALLVAFCCIAPFAVFANAVPPDACFATFRWEDCGKEPQPVMYYWKPGSRCEVGIWRGCLPNYNMFKDEYECVSTCIFAVRAQASSYHNIYSEYEEDGSEETEGYSNSTEMTTTNSTGNDIEDIESVVTLENSTDTAANDTSTPSSDAAPSNSSDAGGEVTKGPEETPEEKPE